MTVDDPLNWLLNHPAKINWKELKDKVKIHNSRKMLETMKDELWMGDFN